jgi:hypothetical protein
MQITNLDEINLIDYIYSMRYPNSKIKNIKYEVMHSALDVDYNYECLIEDQKNKWPYRILDFIYVSYRWLTHAKNITVVYPNRNQGIKWQYKLNGRVFTV